MSRASSTPRQVFGREVLGPIVAEFCLRLWTLTSLLERPDDAALLFCARGGLRMQLAYERFLAATGLPSSVHLTPLMVSRVAAIRPAIQRGLDDGLGTLVPAAASALSYEFGQASVADVFAAVTGVRPVSTDPRWQRRFTPEELTALLRHPDEVTGSATLAGQARLFTRHLHEVLGARRTAVLVDTGLFGTTQDLLAAALPELDVGSVLIARSFRPGGAAPQARTVGLSVEAVDYSPLRPRTALLRYWHYVEWLFEPDLPSVRTFTLDGDRVRSDLEVDGWADRVPPTPGTVFAGVVDHLDALPHGPAERIVTEAAQAWRRYHRAVVWPRREDAEVLGVGTRSHDFGRDVTWEQPAGTSVVAALNGDPMWREGQLARTGSPLRLPLLAALQGAYSARHVTRSLARRRRRGP